MEKIAELKNELGEKFYELYYNSGKNYLYANWIGYMVDEDIINGGNQLMNWLEKNGNKNCRGYINDNRDFKGSWAGIMDWAANTWTPTVYKNGLRHCALILSDDIFAQLSVDLFEEVSAEAGKIETKAFPEFEEAENWIVAKQIETNDRTIQQSADQA